MKIFMLGATGYVGGDLLYLLDKTRPYFDITVLVRNPSKAAAITAEYPRVKIAIGDNDSAEVIKEEATKADVIFHSANSADDIASVATICSALRAKSTSKPTFYIHTSGTGLLCHEAGPGQTRYGKIYDDWDGTNEITSFPIEANHRNVDTMVLELAIAEPERIKTAIICPPAIYGLGRGPVNKRAMALPFLVSTVLRLGYGVAPDDDYIWGQVHVHDLSKLYLLLLEAASIGGGSATWGKDAYYFAEAGESNWKAIVQRVVHEAKKAGLIEREEVRHMNQQNATEKVGPFASLYYSNSRSKALRARKLLGWRPVEVSHEEAVKDTLFQEASRLQSLSK